MRVTDAPKVTPISKKVSKLPGLAKAELQRVGEALKKFVEHITPAPFQRGDGLEIDPFNATKDWMSDRVFNTLRPPGPPEALTGAQRVAYGPLDAPPKLKRPVVMIPGLTMPAQS